MQAASSLSTSEEQFGQHQYLSRKALDNLQFATVNAVGGNAATSWPCEANGDASASTADCSRGDMPGE